MTSTRLIASAGELHFTRPGAGSSHLTPRAHLARLRVAVALVARVGHRGRSAQKVVAEVSEHWFFGPPRPTQAHLPVKDAEQKAAPEQSELRKAGRGLLK
jgi:hypothetical protein